MLNISAVRTQFPSLKRQTNGHPFTYLDGPGGTQVPQSVIDAIVHYYQHSNANSHGEFITTHETDQVINDMRAAMATLLGAEGPHTISLGHNMTTLNFALARGVARVLKPGDEVLITQLDHEGNRGPWLMLRDFGIIVKEIKLLPDGVLDYEDFAAKINDRTRLVAMGISSNFIGTINNIKLARELTYRCGAWLSLDAVHYAPHFLIDVQQMGCDFLLCSAYKFYGPHIGILYSRPGMLDRLMTDRLRTAVQHAPECIETGTPNHAALAGVTAAVNFLGSLGEGSTLREKLTSAYSQISAHEHALGTRLYNGLKSLKGVRVIGQDFSKRHRAPTISVTVDGITANTVCKALGNKNIFAWDGNFYAQRAAEVLGLHESGGVTRFGLSAYNTEEEVDRALAAVAALKA
ncbi:MAG: cysteine desulfurase-like protein [Cyclobacteriaceae bacterium]